MGNAAYPMGTPCCGSEGTSKPEEKKQRLPCQSNASLCDGSEARGERRSAEGVFRSGATHWLLLAVVVSLGENVHGESGDARKANEGHVAPHGGVGFRRGTRASIRRTKGNNWKKNEESQSLGSAREASKAGGRTGGPPVGVRLRARFGRAPAFPRSAGTHQAPPGSCLLQTCFWRPA